MKPPRLYTLTTSCPDTTGIVAGVAGFLASHNATITEAQHYDDPFTQTSFMRTVFFVTWYLTLGMKMLLRGFLIEKAFLEIDHARRGIYRHFVNRWSFFLDAM